ncbi:MAG: hypothetical protein JOZ83_11325 [Silvibacterium sp.]|nr:hypothetical protein [Silvibacterium sp.]
MTTLAGWETFYEIVGCSAGALIGLQFVSITLLASRPAVQDRELAGAAFATPTVVHFGAVLLLAGIVSAPWQGVAVAAVLWGLTGLVGILYGVVVAQRMGKQPAYKPVFEDWQFYAVLPLAAYITLLASAAGSRSNAGAALFGVGGAALTLLFTGIHNAWDAATYHVFVKAPSPGED